MKNKPYTAEELLGAAISAKKLDPMRVLATFADPKNWVKLYEAEEASDGYEPKACEWAFIGPVRPPYELAQHVLQWQSNEVTCQRCGNYFGGHATGAGDICCCAPEEGVET